MNKPAIPSSWAFTRLGDDTEYGRANKAEPNGIEYTGIAPELAGLKNNPPLKKGGLGGIHIAHDDEAQL